MTTCSVCHQGVLHQGTTSYEFEHIEIRGVPAHVCGACGAAWLDDLVAGRVLDCAARARRAAGAPVRRYVTV